MEMHGLDSPALTLGLAMAAGMLAQLLARHLRIPGIVLLLLAGLLLGPDLLGVVRPDALGPALQILVGFAVAVILFEGGMNLDLKRLRREASNIRRLVTLGAAVTAVGGALAVRLILGWDWRIAILFGTLVIVTGPTVINPLLRRIRVERRVATVLEAEGVFGDAIGAVVAVVALEVALSPSFESFAEGITHLLARFGIGAVLGLAGGGLLALLLRREGVVPEGLESVLTLSLVLALFQVSNGLLEESGIVTVTVAGLMLGNIGTPALEDLRQFKEQLTVLLIGMLFVLLAADVRIAEVEALGVAGLAAVLALMLVVRPLNVALSTFGSELGWRERTFLSWLAPRGIVAAAVSSLFALRLQAAGIAGGVELRALVFLVIAVTVVIQGLSGGWVASLLGLRLRPEGGYAILGANHLARTVARALRDDDEKVVLIDSNPHACNQAEEEGLKVIFGSGLAESVLQRSALDDRDGCIGLTANEGVNFAFVRRARLEFGVRHGWVALAPGKHRVTSSMVESIGARVLFGRPRDVEKWSARLGNGRAEVLHFVRGEAEGPVEWNAPAGDEDGRLPLVSRRGSKLLPVDETGTESSSSAIAVVVTQESRDAMLRAFEEGGFRRVSAGEETAVEERG